MDTELTGQLRHWFLTYLLRINWNATNKASPVASPTDAKHDSLIISS